MSAERPRLRYFTPREANQLLPELARLMEEATHRAQRFQEIMGAVRGGATPEGQNRQAAVREAEQLRREARGMLEEISRHGVEVKGLEQGLLDFPAMRHGQEVLLCWRRGEPSVAWWHPLKTGFAGRQPLDPDDEAPWVWYN